MYTVIEALKTFLLNIKEVVPISVKSSIKFVKKGIKVPCKMSPSVGVLHHASDWVLLADLNSNYSFAVYTSFIQQRPDITNFSNSLRKVILIELTCPCEENMKSWHGTKMLGDTAVHLLYAVLKCWVSLINLSGTLLKNQANLLWNALFVSGWPETLKS